MSSRCLYGQLLGRSSSLKVRSSKAKTVPAGSWLTISRAILILAARACSPLSWDDEESQSSKYSFLEYRLAFPGVYVVAILMMPLSTPTMRDTCLRDVISGFLKAILIIHVPCLYSRKAIFDFQELGGKGMPAGNENFTVTFLPIRSTQVKESASLSA